MNHSNKHLWLPDSFISNYFSSENAFGNSVKLHFISAEPIAKYTSDRTLVVCLHGFPQCSAIFAPLMSELSGNKLFFPIALDLRGYHGSDKPKYKSDYQMTHLVKDTINLIQYMNENSQQHKSPPAIIVGHDWGGMVAWHLALFAPNLVKKLITLNAPHPCMLVNQLLENSEQEKASEYIQHITEPDEIAIPFIEKDDYLYFQKIFESKSGHSTLSTTTFNQLKHTWKLPGALSAMLNYYRATLVTPAKNESDREQLRQVVERYKNMPSIMSDNLCIWGKEDPYFTHECFKPQSNDTQSLGRIHFLCIENCGHWIPHEKPNIVLEQILCC